MHDMLPRMPQLENAFHVWVEIKTERSNRTELVEEYMDINNNIAVLRLLSNGLETKTIFLYDVTQTLVFMGTNCTVGNNISDPSLFVAEALNTSGMTYLPTGLFSSLSAPKVYAGRQEVRGIPCDRWHACVSMPHVNYTVDFYFTVHDWQMPSSYPQVPVRFVVQGQQSLDPGSPSPFTRMFDFFGYEAQSVVDEKVFETPRGIVCRGRKGPVISTVLITSDFYHYRQESVDIVNNIVRGSEVWYDSTNKFVRVDYNLPNGGPMSEVHDFNFGTRYLINVSSGQCTQTKLERNNIDSMLNAQAYLLNDSYVLTMKNPLSFFFLDSNVIYSGQRKTRDVMCHVYTSQRSNFDYFNNGSAYMATVEAYFVFPLWTDVSSHTYRMMDEPFVPFRVELTIPTLDIDTVFNIYDYDDNMPDMEVFDVAGCFNSSARLDFRVRFVGGYGQQYNGHTGHLVADQAQHTLATIMQVNPLRVTRVRVEYDTSYIYILGSLLDRIPSLVQFTRLPNSVIEQSDDFRYPDIPSAAACSEMCMLSSGFRCMSFEYCPDGWMPCRLSRRHVSDGESSVSFSRCDLYSRTIDAQSTTEEPTIGEAYSNLLKNLGSPDFFVPVSMSDISEAEAFFVAIASEIIFGDYENVQLPSLPAKFSYRMEIVLSQNSIVNVYDVWYDSPNQLVRIDFHDIVPGPPYYTPYTVTRIHDFTRGTLHNHHLCFHQWKTPLCFPDDIDLMAGTSS